MHVRFFRDVALTGGTQVIQAALAMVGGILVARFLGPSAKGALTTLVALGSMAVLLASLGVHQSSVYFLGRFKSDHDAVVSNTTIFGLAGGILAGTGLAIFGIIFHRQLLHGIAISLFLVYILAVPCNYFNEFARRIALGAGRVGIYNLPDLVGGTGLLVGTLGAILVFGNHLLPLVVFRVLTEAAISVMLLVYVRKVIQVRFQTSRRVLRQQVSYGIRNYTSLLFWVFLLQSDLILCNYFLGSGPTGVYSVAVSLGVPVTILGSVLGTLVKQRVSADESAASRVANTNRVMRLLVPAAGVTVLVIGISASWIIPLLYGHQFHAASEALRLLLPGLFSLTLEVVLMSFLAGEGSPPIIYWAPLLGLVANLVPNLLVIPRWGINGAAVTSSIGYTIVLSLVFGYYIRSTGSSPRQVLIVHTSDINALRGRSDVASSQSAANARPV
jgi:O-antigen/teichoic acid export membrane protein